MKKNKYYDMLYEEGLKDEPAEEIPEENLLPFDEAAGEQAYADSVKSVLFLIAALTVVECLIVLFFVSGFITEWNRGKGQALLGLFLGSGYAVFWFYTIRWQLEGLLMPDVKHGKWKLKLGAVARILLLIGLAALGYFTGVFNPITLVIGAFNLKIAAFLAPFVMNGLKRRRENAGS